MLYVLTLSYNGLDKLEKLKDSLLPALSDIDYVWAIKDNGSTDDTVKTASTWGDKVVVYDYHNNLQNFSEGMNYLFDKVKPNDDDLILFMNNDVQVVDKSSIKKMISVISEKDVGIVGARLLFTNTNNLQHAGIVFNKNKSPLNFRNKEKTDKYAEKKRLFQACTAAVMLTKASVYKNVCTTNKSGISGMDEKFHWAFDDVDFCLAVTYSLKKKVIYLGDTCFYHEESATLKTRPSNKLFMSSSSKRIQEKWGKVIVPDEHLYKKDYLVQK